MVSPCARRRPAAGVVVVRLWSATHFVAQHAARLEAVGFTVRSLQLFERPTPFARDVGDWLTLMAVPFLAALPDDRSRQEVVDEVRETLRPQLLDSQGVWQLDYVRLRFVAEKPA
jgi:hypothetical protein